ncbi:MAG: hypothetical protein ACOX9E_15540, partial [Lentisphaeria bacterium]
MSTLRLPLPGPPPTSGPLLGLDCLLSLGHHSLRHGQRLNLLPEEVPLVLCGFQLGFQDGHS